MKNNLYKSAAQVTVFSTTEKFISFIYRIVLSRIIGAEGIGIYQICLSVFAVFLTASSSGIPITVSRLIAKNNAEGNVRGKHAVVSAGVLCTLMFTVPTAVILFFGRNLLGFLFTDKSCIGIFLILLPGLVLTSIYAVMRGTFWGNKHFLPYSLIEFFETIVMVVCGCILISFSSNSVQGAMYATIAVLVSYVFSFAVSLSMYFKYGGRFVNPKNEIKPLLASAMPITTMRTSTAMINSLVAMFLPAILVSACGYTNTQAVALYGTVLGMSMPVLMTPNSLIGSIAVVVAPEMSEDFYSHRPDKLKIDIEKSIKASLLISLIVAPTLFTVGKDLGIFLYSNTLSGVTITKFSFILLPMSISNITTTILNSMNYEVKTLIHYFISAIVMLLCIFTLTPTLGIYSYMAGLALSCVITSVLNLRLLHKNCEGLDYLGYILKSVAVYVFACLFGWLLNNLFVGVLPLIWRIIVCGGGVLLFTIGTVYALNMVTVHITRLFAK
jgi:stage V sporulation protein B